MNGVGSLTSVLVQKASKNNTDDIFDHIYVTLDPTQDPYKIKEDIQRANEEMKSKEVQSKSSKDYVPISLPVIQ